ELTAPGPIDTLKHTYFVPTLRGYDLQRGSLRRPRPCRDLPTQRCQKRHAAGPQGEFGDAQSLVDAPTHPRTGNLIASVPVLRRSVGTTSTYGDYNDHHPAHRSR